MPTPFMHLAFAERVKADSLLPDSARLLLTTEWGAFLLGNIAADARVSSGIRRADTHFFEYVPVIETPPFRAMLAQNPQLRRSVVTSEAQAAFMAGYVAHLAMDEIWCVQLLFPYFMRPWPDQFTSFKMLHMLLANLDERDYQSLPRTEQYAALSTATPTNWLPFIPDPALVAWRDLIAAQIAPDGHSQTVEILAQRIMLNGEDMRAFLADSAKMEQDLWLNVPHEAVQKIEVAMYERGREALLAYLAS